MLEHCVHSWVEFIVLLQLFALSSALQSLHMLQTTPLAKKFYPSLLPITTTSETTGRLFPCLQGVADPSQIWQYHCQSISALSYF
jgi:hypothetical protein